MRLKFIIWCIIFFAVKNNYAQIQNTSFFNENWLKSIVSIEIVDDSLRGIPIGTGFIITTTNKHLALITAKHVIIDDSGKVIKNLAYRLNKNDSTSILIPDFLIPKEYAGEGWFLSEHADVACRFVIILDNSDTKSISINFILRENELKTTTPILVPGFPLGLRSEKFSNPIVRHGIVARCEENRIILDAFIFPGNSGGPVFYVPNIKVDNQTISSPILNEQRLIGLISAYIPYVDVAISNQTKRARISFEENSGLCIAVPVDDILELLNRTDVIKAEKMIKYVK